MLSLANVVDPPGGTRDETRSFPAITQWLLTTLLDALPPLVQPDQWTTAKTAYESRLLQALAGPPSDAERADDDVGRTRLPRSICLRPSTRG